jgi:hypothetical protein
VLKDRVDGILSSKEMVVVGKSGMDDVLSSNELLLVGRMVY